MWLQDTHHHGVVVVHPICRGLPHFALPLLLVSTNQPPQGEASWDISQPNDCHDKDLGPGARVMAPGSGRGIRPGSYPRGCPNLGPRRRR